MYKLGNVSWDAIYRLTTNGQTEGELVVEGVIFNNSSKDYFNANINLVEGIINKSKPKQTNNYSEMAMSRSVVQKNTPAELGDYYISLQEHSELYF